MLSLPPTPPCSSQTLTYPRVLIIPLPVSPQTSLKKLSDAQHKEKPSWTIPQEAKTTPIWMLSIHPRVMTVKQILK